MRLGTARIQRQEQEMRGPARSLRDVVLPVHLAAAAHHEQVAGPGLDVA